MEWKLGIRLTPPPSGDLLPTQKIDVMEVSPFSGRSVCVHGGKIEVHGRDCTEVAQRIIDFLNTQETTNG
jgi:hypothetical protein